jgi:HAD superfamily hydrolase (TIGR01509 family)
MNDPQRSPIRFRLRIAAPGRDEPPARDDRADDLTEAAQKFRAVDGVVFDMGDILFDATLWRRRLLQILRGMGLNAAYRSFFSLWDHDYLDAVHRGEREYHEAFLAFLRDAGLSPGQIDEVAAASQQIKRQLESETRLFPGVRETLELLQSRGLRMGVLSDSESPAATIAERLRAFGIGDYLPAVVSSVELHQTKPHRHCYLTAVERLGTKTARTVFVGHDAEELAGARRCGLRTIAFNYDRDASADCRVGKFRDLAVLLDRPVDGGSYFAKAA